MDNKSIIGFPLKSPEWGWPAFVVIAFMRAWQPGNSPMEEWSAWSWFLMSLPVTLPYLGCAFAFLVWLPLASALAWLCERLGRRF